MENRNVLEVHPDTVHRIILGHCYRYAGQSPDKSTQLAAMVVSKNETIQYATLSYNSPVKGWDVQPEDHERPRKYLIGEHAERRAIYTAARLGILTEGATLYCTWAACVDCARAIVESGITRLVRHYPPLDDATERWLESVTLGDQIMKAGGVEIVDILGPIPNAPSILRGGELFDPQQ